MSVVTAYPINNLEQQRKILIDGTNDRTSIVSSSQCIKRYKRALIVDALTTNTDEGRGTLR